MKVAANIKNNLKNTREETLQFLIGIANKAKSALITLVKY